MELAIPLVALGGLYVISNQKKSNQNGENFQNKNYLPNVDIADKNFPPNSPIISTETDLTSKLSTVNKYDTPSAYTDKYFNYNYVPEGVLTGGITLNDITRGYNYSKEYKSLTGENVDGSYFTHNNMVPFFGSKVRSTNIDNNQSESVLDNYTGAGSQTIIKKEQSPLFEPGTNFKWNYGMPNASEFYLSRVNPSTKMSNVKPFEEQRVAPGIGLGYTTDGAGGYNSGLMSRDQWKEKTVDELRVASNPKSSGYLMLDREGPAYSKVTNRGFVGNVEKNRPERAFEMGQDRLFTTTGIEKGQTLRSEQIDRHVSRPETTTDYTGIASYNNPATYTTGEYMPSTHIDLGPKPFGVAGANGKNTATESDYGIKSKFAYPNNRSAVQQDSYFGAVGGVIGEAVAPFLDVLRPSRKENTVGNLRPYENAKSRVPGSYVYDPNTPLPTTIRETTENSKFHLNINANQRGGAYMSTEYQGTNTNRQETSDFYYGGNASAGAGTRSMKSYEAEYNQRNNDIKSSTIQGYMVKGNMSLLNSDVNMSIATNRDNLLANNRPVASSGVVTQTPSIDHMGQMSGAQPLYQTINADRNTPDILSSLQGNPYVIPYRAK